MEMILIKIDSPEWDYMWNWIAEHPLNKDNAEPMVCSNEGEVWQYMGSFMNDNKVVHEFRHRLHPVTGERAYLKLNGSPAFNENDVEKRLKAK